MRQIALLIAFMSAALLAGCGDHPAVTVNDGECKAFRRAAVETCGLTEADQDVIDEQIERGVSACKWKRPQPRTPSCADLRKEISELRKEKPPAAKPVVKKSLLDRVLRR